MKKRIWTATLFLGLCALAFCLQGQSAAQAKEQSAGKEQVGKQGEMREPVSRGSIIYWDDDEKMGIYAADFALLYEKLSSISGEIFDPAGYTHTYRALVENAGACAEPVASEFWTDGQFVGIKWETEAVEPDSIPGNAEENGSSEIAVEETETPVAEEESENEEEEPELSGSGDSPEIMEEESGITGPGDSSGITGEETGMPETEETPGASVSENDCRVEEG